MIKKFQIKNTAEMKKFGGRVAGEVSAEPLGKQAKVISLTGELGVGKTTFTQGFLKALGVKRRVISPTFLIIRPYKLKVNNSQRMIRGGVEVSSGRKQYVNAYHIDCYRLHKPQELLALGLKEILNNHENIVLVEWPQLIEKYLPKKTRRVTIEHSKKGTCRVVRY